MTGGRVGEKRVSWKAMWQIWSEKRVGQGSVQPWTVPHASTICSTEDATDIAFASLVHELKLLDTFDDELMVRPTGTRNVVPSVASGSVPNHSWCLKGLPLSVRTVNHERQTDGGWTCNDDV